MVLKRAADLAEALYSMPPRAAGHHFALSSSPAAAAGPASSQLALAPTSPVSAVSSPAVAATQLTPVMAGFNGYPGHGGEYQQQLAGWDDSWTHRYHQAFSFWRQRLLMLLHVRPQSRPRVGYTVHDRLESCWYLTQNRHNRRAPVCEQFLSRTNDGMTGYCFDLRLTVCLFVCEENNSKCYGGFSRSLENGFIMDQKKLVKFWKITFTVRGCV